MSDVGFRMFIARLDAATDLWERAFGKLRRSVNRLRGMCLQPFLAECLGPVSIGPDLVLRGRRHIRCLGSFTAMKRNRIEAWDRHGNQRFSPTVIFGNNVSMEDDCHIAAIERVEIHDNVLIASKVYISDHSHGSTSHEDMKMPPHQRLVRSGGPVVIESNVWIGEGAAVLPGVTIGRGSIVGANAVVTRSVPSYCTVGGAPARVINRHPLAETELHSDARKPLPAAMTASSPTPDDPSPRFCQAPR